MALGTSACGTAKGYMGSICEASGRMIEEADTFTYVIGQGDFQDFASDTNLGSSIQNNLTKAVQGISALNDAINVLKADTENYLAEQEALNSQSV